MRSRAVAVEARAGGAGEMATVAVPVLVRRPRARVHDGRVAPPGRRRGVGFVFGSRLVFFHARAFSRAAAAAALRGRLGFARCNAGFAGA